MIIDKMKTLDHLTIQEKYLVDYIINNQEDILKKNILLIYNRVVDKSFIYGYI